ncbi:MAG: sensor of ECF-type sigma factor [Flavobacteriia bacterium]|nr:sensor of ECF-type sigma factor [Flavobacteriia bacterium]OIP45373.1 MAG: hypothetical protein AUK46_12140 [Flavobacteriaceae bacterium CG2_30_31_66]PIV96083.1 MAG: sensor of ECF-type sigma factor [Flavobacteriaceae bacterium CG17_big_fil_post_rev_8_21_14_2_50_31_13]PIX13837.1 MAG: sensor of ECF-type sigma factor [Flavobacteriaceae bacterium CG_4_8_14_3_um_filter_31_8]PIY13995.1 MAG: sensor of ECF-type sigma factor [Flavobacteriaceae bacterium CG_4_10_14_3_um_filter_31_253]PIZ11037.1 MAG: s
MKKIYITILMMLFLVISIKAQGRNESREKIKSLKIAYLTEQLNLTTNEAEKFWPIYNSFDQEQQELRIKQRSEIHKVLKERGEIDVMDEKEAEKLIMSKLAIDKLLFESQKEFIQKIKKIISYKKIIKLQMAEMEFGRKLMKKYHQNGNRN